VCVWGDFLRISHRDVQRHGSSTHVSCCSLEYSSGMVPFNLFVVRISCLGVSPGQGGGEEGAHEHRLAEHSPDQPCGIPAPEHEHWAAAHVQRQQGCTDPRRVRVA
jgi:hypothetical protein